LAFTNESELLGLGTLEFKKTEPPLQKVVGPFAVITGAAGFGLTLTTTFTKELVIAPISQRTLYVVLVVRFGVVKGEPVNGMATELALYQVGIVPGVQVAVNEAVLVLVLQIIGLLVPVGVATFTVTTVVAVAAQLLPYEILTV
jgi:hypothetical protein